MHVKEFVTSLIGGTLVTVGGWLCQVATNTPELLTIGGAFTVLLAFTLKGYLALQDRVDKRQVAADAATAEYQKSLIALMERQLADKDLLQTIIVENTVAKRDLLSSNKEVVAAVTAMRNALVDKKDA